jgi:hypothetical protein
MRVAVVGGSRAGKTTLSRRLAHLLGVPHIELDALHHDPDWDEAPAELLRQRVEAARPERPRRLPRSSVSDRAAACTVADVRSRVAPARALERQPRDVPHGILLGRHPALGPAHAPFATDGDGRERLAGDAVVRLCSRREIERFVQSIQATATMSGSSNGSELQNTPPLRET